VKNKFDSVVDLLSGVSKRRVVIFGGAGSLGGFFVNLLKDSCDLTVWDNSEWATAEMDGEYPNVRFVLDDMTNWKYTKDPADVVIILAAYKHIDLGERNVWSFIDNNLVRLKSVLDEAQFGNADVLYVSTDKAVQPISAYGATKMLAEKMVSNDYGGSFARLGNIVASSGSVIPLWEKAIADGEPIPVTDERMTRYFIEGADAANQIWWEFVRGEKVIIPKCEKKRILDILAEVLKKHGYDNASDYKPGITVIGMRPGEKLEEVLEWPQL